MGVDGEPSQPVTVPGHRFVRAVEWVTELHGAQARKGGDVPYVAHLLEVGALVLEDGGTESEAIAGLLHDAIEDAHVKPKRIRKRFGRKVARIVEGCTETLDGRLPTKKHAGPRDSSTWRARKQESLAHLARPRHTKRRAAGQGRRRAGQRPVDRGRPPAARPRGVAALPRRRGRPALVLPVARASSSPSATPARSPTSSGRRCATWSSWPGGGSTWATRNPAATDRRARMRRSSRACLASPHVRLELRRSVGRHRGDRSRPRGARVRRPPHPVGRISRIAPPAWRATSSPPPTSGPVTAWPSISPTAPSTSRRSTPRCCSARCP